MQKIALTVPEAIEAAPIGRTRLYAALRNGQLKAKKFGKRTLILSEDFQSFLKNLPDYASDKAAANNP